MVVTDSFHGTAFSLIFEKNFVCINPKDELGHLKNNERIVNILTITNLKEHYISMDDINDFDFHKDTDYIVEGSSFSFFEDGRISKFFKHRDSTASILAFGKLYGYPWGKIVKSAMFRNIRFPEQFWFEDTLFAMIIYPKANIVHTVSDEVYAYRVNMKGITQSARNNPRAIESLWITECLIAEQKSRTYYSKLHTINTSIRSP